MIYWSHMDKSIWVKIRAAVAAFFSASPKTSVPAPKDQKSLESVQAPTASIIAFRQIQEEPLVMSIVYSMASNSDAMPFTGLARALQTQDQVQRVPIQPQKVASANEMSAKFEGALWRMTSTVPSELAKQVEADKQQGYKHVFVTRQDQVVGYYVLSQ